MVQPLVGSQERLTLALTKQALRALAPFAEPPHVDDAAELLPAAPLDAIAYGFMSSAYVIGGVEGEAEMSARLERPPGASRWWQLAGPRGFETTDP